MKTPLLLLLSLVTTVLSAQPLLLHYTFAPDSPAGVIDASGNNRNGQVTEKAATIPLVGTQQWRAFDNSESLMGATEPGTGGSVRFKGANPGALQSFTAAFWFKTKSGQALTRGTRLFEFLGIAPKDLLLAASTDDGNLSLNLGGTSIVANGTPQELLNVPGRWVFVAVTYDGAYSQDNVRLYVGAKDRPLAPIALAGTTERLWTGGQGLAELVFGANARNGRALSGFLADIRLYGSASDSSGALTGHELELVMNACPVRD